MARSTVVLSSIMFSPFLLLGLLAIFKTAQPTSGLLLSAGYMLGVYAFCSPTVILKGQTLTYRTVLGSRSVDLPSVNRVWVTADPVPTLRLHTEGRSAPFSFTIKPFSKAGVAAIMQHIHALSPTAHFDALSSDLLRGDFASVTREVLTVENLIRIALTVGGAIFAAAAVRSIFH